MIKIVVFLWYSVKSSNSVNEKVMKFVYFKRKAVKNFGSFFFYQVQNVK